MNPNVDLIQMTGIMDLDSPYDVFPPFHHRYLMNGRFRGAGNNRRLETIPGNVLIPNAFLPAGTNECIGAFYDEVKKRIIWFNYNSNGRNGIYKYSLETKTISKIFVCFTDSTTNILNFSLDYPIHSANIVYRPDQDGDMLYWTDKLNRPKALNINTVSTLAPFISDMLNAGKNAPVQTLTVVYDDDSNITVNNLNKKLFRFSYILQFADLSKSTMSPISEVPLPVDGFNQTVLNDPTKNNTIVIDGVARLSDNATVGDIIAVEIFMQVNEGDTWSGFCFVVSIPSSDFSVGTFQFRFLNDSSYVIEPTLYVNEDPAQGLIYYSWLPDNANTMELLNGNTIIYGGITEGYPNLQKSECEVRLFSGLGEGPNALTINAVNVSVTELNVIIGGSASSNTNIRLRFRYDNGVVFTVDVDYTPGPTDTLAAITAAFVVLLNAEFVSLGIGGEVSAAQVGLGNTISMRTNNPAGTFPSQYVEYTNESSFTVPYPNAVLKWASQYRWGLVYYDERGKTNGVISYVDTTNLNNFGFVSLPFATMSVPPGNQFVPYMMASINHLPPSWARRFQWVRTSNQTTNKIIELTTNDYQTDTDYLYFCIQNLFYLKTKNTGFLPTYQFAAGDRVRIIASYNTANGDRTVYAPQLDLEILGTAERTMAAPNTTVNGTFIKVKKPLVAFPSYTQNNFIEIYTPLPRLAGEDQVFFEFGETFELNANQVGSTQLYHGGNLSDQDATQPATFLFYKGDFYFKPRLFYLNVGGTVTDTQTVMDTDYSDYFASGVNSDGRGQIINPDAATTYNPVLDRWGRSYQQDTNVNQINIFQPLDFDTIDRAKGDILRFLVEDRILYVYQTRGVGNYGIYSKYIQNNEGVKELVTTNDIITANNIDYLKGNYGLGDQPCAVFRSDGDHYFTDPVRGDIVRRAGDGLTPIGELYYGQYDLRDKVAQYNRTFLRANGSKAKLMGFYDFFEGNAHFILQAGTLMGDTILTYNFSFNEKNNGFLGFYQDNPEWCLQGNKVTYGWKNGQMYIYNDEGTDRRLFGEKFETKFTLIFNDKAAVRKKYLSLGYQSPDKWTCSKLQSFIQGENIDAIITSFINPQTGFRQSSRLKDFDIDADGTEGQITAAFLRDMNSGQNTLYALNELDYLLGWWIQIEFTYNGGGFSYFYAPFVTWVESNRQF